MQGYITRVPKISKHERILNEKGYFLKLEFETTPGTPYAKERCVLCKNDGNMNSVNGVKPIVGEWNEPLGKLLYRIGWLKPVAKKEATA